MHINRLERYWLTAVAAMLGTFVAALVDSVTIFGIRLPSPVNRVDPQRLDLSEFAEPGIRNVGGIGQRIPHLSRVAARSSR